MPPLSVLVKQRIAVETPAYGLNTPDGSFTIENVPAGKYVVKAWHERGGEAGSEVTVTETGTTQTRFTLDGSTYKSVPHKNKFGKDYSTDEKY